MADSTEATETKPKRPAMRRWIRMGVELEGGWDTNYKTIAGTVAGAQAATDESIKASAAWLHKHIGELKTKPHETLEKLLADVDALYPQHMNETCGLHVHASFSPLDTSVLADKPFWNYFRTRFEAWGKATGQGDLFWNRFHTLTDMAKRKYKAEFKPVEQLYLHQDRYTQLNFVAYSKYETVECRLFPMWPDREVAKMAIRELSDIYDTYLNETQFPHIKVESVLKEVGEMVIESKSLKLTSPLPWEETHKRGCKGLIVGPDIEYTIPGGEGYMFPLVNKIEEEGL